MSKGPEKVQRMARRAAIGNRVLEPIPPRSPHVGPRYLVAYACFRCRKSSKHPPAEKRMCPQCRGPIHEMGRSFRAPRQATQEQWLKIQVLYALGFRFVGNGNYEGERLPRNLRQVSGFVARNPKHRLRLAEVDESLLPEHEG